MFIKPAPGIQVRDPRSKLRIPETGIEVSATDTYWARRLADGDVVVAEPKPAAAPAKTPPAKGKEQP
jgi:hypothetical protein